MAFSKYNRDRPFLIVHRSRHPSEGQRTEQKNWAKVAKWKTDEHVSIVDSIKTKHLYEAFVIIDILKRSIVKVRDSSTDQKTVVSEYLSKYKDYIADGIDVWTKNKIANNKDFAAELSNDLQEEIDKLKPGDTNDK